MSNYSWLQFSVGPDGVRNIMYEDVHVIISEGSGKKKMKLDDYFQKRFELPVGSFKLRTPDLIYDPTNGLVSSGDLLYGHGSLDWITTSTINWENFIEDPDTFYEAVEKKETEYLP